MKEIPALVRTPAAATASAPGPQTTAAGAAPAAAADDALAIPYPSAALFVNGKAAGGWSPIEAMGHEACVWCRLREDAAAAGGPSTRVS